MRKAFIVAAGLVLAATSAWGQSSSRDRDDYERRDWRENRSTWHRDSDRWRDRAMRDDDDDDRSGSGARFFLRSGDTQLRVVCGDRESTQACVDAALRMFDRVQAQPGTTTRPPASPSTPSPQ